MRAKTQIFHPCDVIPQFFQPKGDEFIGGFFRKEVADAYTFVFSGRVSYDGTEQKHLFPDMHALLYYTTGSINMQDEVVFPGQI